MPPKRRRFELDTGFDMDHVQRMIKESLAKQIARPNLYAYKPHEKQMLFHTSTAHQRLYIGGNRSGKTTGGVVEDCYWLMKRHPYRRIGLPEGPVRGRAVAVDFNYGVAQILLPEFARWLPPSFLINGSWEDSYNREHRILTLANESTIEFKSYDQDLEKFAGTSRHFTHYDEEAPLHIYDECQARLVDTDGYSWMTMTPVEGMSWVYDKLYIPGKEGHEDISVIEVDMLDNPHINPQAAERYLSGLSPEDRLAREKGRFVELGGKVFKDFSRDRHIIPPMIPPKSWKWYVSIDHGFNNPTAVLWHAVGPLGQTITFDEHYAAEMTVAEHAKVIHAKIAGHGRIPDHFVGDPAMHQRNAATGTSIMQEYAKHDIFIAEAQNDVKPGIDKMISYLRTPYLDPDREASHPMWEITADCPKLVWEMERLAWQKWASKKVTFENNKQEKIHKKDDHACDSARYFFSFLPDLKPSAAGTTGILQQIRANTALMGATNAVRPDGRIDRNSARVGTTGTSWALTTVGTDAQGLEY